MRSPFYFIVSPNKGRRYDNTKEIGGVDVITSTSEEDFRFSTFQTALAFTYEPIKSPETISMEYFNSFALPIIKPSLL